MNQLMVGVGGCLVVITLAAIASGDTYNIEGSMTGLPLHSIGAQSTAGTARLLYDYPDQEQSEILDLLFKPNYGASLQHLKVEIGGDAQISCGSEASPIRSSNFSDSNFDRGYEHWLMMEAKRRNPDITLLGLVYAFPSWINPVGNTPYASNETEQQAALYVSEWVAGIKQVHNLTIDYVGLFNEREYTVSYIERLKAALVAKGLDHVGIIGSDRNWDPISSDYLQNQKVRDAITALSQHYPHCDARGGKPGTGHNDGQCTGSNKEALQANQEYGVALFSSEDYSCWTDALGAGVWASEINSNYIGGNIVMTSAWHLISAFYPTVAFWNEGMMSATEPWSGHYVVSPTIWATAHTTQFTEGQGRFRYLLQGHGSGALTGGGTYVSLVSNNKSTLTIVIETAGESIGPFSANNCNGHCNYGPALVTQNISFMVSGLAFSESPTMSVWRTRLGTNSTSAADAEDHIFERLVPIRFEGNLLTISVEPNAIYTISNAVTGSKAGGKATPIPPSSPFPLPYSDDFDSLDLSRPPRFWSDMGPGSFEIALEPADPDDNQMNKNGNQVMVQSLTTRACCNFIPNLDGPLPLAIIGSSSWEDISVSVLVKVPKSGGFGAVGIRAMYGYGTFFSGGLGRPTGLFLGVDSKGWMLLTSIDALGSGQALPWSDPQSCLLSGIYSDGSNASSWIPIRLQAYGRMINVTVFADKKSIQIGLESTITRGFVAITSSYNLVAFDNFQVTNSVSSKSSAKCSNPQPGQKLVNVGCGEPSVRNGSRWQIEGGDGGVGPISLRSDSNLCLDYSAGPPPALSPDGIWNTTTSGFGTGIKFSNNFTNAEWPNHPGIGWDAIALVSTDGQGSFPKTNWFYVLSGNAASFADIGWCTSDIDKSGTTWVGWQNGKSWVYRGFNGRFKIANGTQDQGAPYGPTFGPGTNVTAVQHSNQLVEYFVNGKSLGQITLPPRHVIPDDAVFCVGGAGGTVISMRTGKPISARIELAECSGKQSQLWRYDSTGSGIQHVASGGYITAAPEPSASLAVATIQASPTPLWWSPDLQTGMIHGDSNHPMGCPCLGVCS